MGLDAVNLLLRVERAFGVSLPDSTLPEINTLGQFLDAVLRAKRAQGHELDPQAAWEQFAEIVSCELAVRRNELHPDLRLIEDLNCG
jgi:hypothetical protein